MADYEVDCRRLGAIDWIARSGSPNDTQLPGDSGEILAAALIFGLLGLDGIRITSIDATGKKLEKPDLDVTFADGTTVGVEAADVIATSQRRHDA
jgi:hypothetical protein